MSSSPAETPRSGLRTQIYIAYALIAAVCLSAVAAAFVAQRRLLANIESSERTDRLFTGVLEIDRDVQELQTRTAKYLGSGVASERALAERICESLSLRVGAASEAALEPSVRDALDRMREHLTTFRSQLTLAAEERDLRTRLVGETLPASGEDVAERLRAEIAASAGDAERVERLRSLLDTFRDAERRLANYLADPRYREIEAMSRHLDAADRLAEGLPEDVGGLLAEFRRLALRAFQATRGYLYFSNVVMAGEVSEFVHYSDLLKRDATSRLELIREKRASDVHRTETLGVLWTLAAVVAAALLATQLTGVLTKPLTDLRDTFLSLSAGETVEDIPAARRRDEVGQMAAAAQVFSDKNRETEELLRETKRQADLLDEQAARLRETVEELDKFAYVASHDLKSPLRGIKNLAEWIEEDAGDRLPGESREHLDLIHNRVTKMDALLDDLLRYSRVGRVRAEPEEVDVEELVDSVREMLDSPAEVRVTTPLPTLRTVRTPLQQVILNLVTNAAKYNDKGPDGLIEIACEDAAAAGGTPMVRLSVCDNGIGIEPQNFGRVFEMYQRLTPDQAEGSGMGLAIVKKQVESFGGEIGVTSEPGEGACFSFTWPREPAARRAAA